jgi:hypothetical protein
MSKSGHRGGDDRHHLQRWFYRSQTALEQHFTAAFAIAQAERSGTDDFAIDGGKYFALFDDLIEEHTKFDPIWEGGLHFTLPSSALGQLRSIKSTQPRPPTPIGTNVHQLLPDNFPVDREFVSILTLYEPVRRHRSAGLHLVTVMAPDCTTKGWPWVRRPNDVLCANPVWPPVTR